MWIDKRSTNRTKILASKRLDVQYTLIVKPHVLSEYFLRHSRYIDTSLCLMRIRINRNDVVIDDVRVIEGGWMYGGDVMVGVVVRSDGLLVLM